MFESLLISYSLYGRGGSLYYRYYMGALANIELARVHYPGAMVRIYCEDGTDAAPFEGPSVQVVFAGKSNGHSGMMWRFRPAREPETSRVIFRDLDSRLGPREAAAVREWIESGLPAHCMADHEFHRCMPIFAGMFGLMGGAIPEAMPEWDRFLSATQGRVADMRLLWKTVWPLIATKTLRHSSVPQSAEFGPAKDFPVHDPWCDASGRNFFVGQQCLPDGTGIWP